MSLHQKPSRIFPVVLCGGTGKRLWPLSRDDIPKQFLRLLSDKSLLQETILRLPERDARSGLAFAAPLLIANRAHEEPVLQQLQEIGKTACRLVLEPKGRNTAAAAAVAGVLVSGEDPCGILVILSADHFIGDVAGFRDRLSVAIAAANNGAVAVFGIAPTSPETGYGYIEAGAPIAGIDGAQAVVRFIEKPPLADAQRYLSSGKFLWNSGMFVVRADVLLEEMQRFCPAILGGVSALLEAAGGANPVTLGDGFERVPSAPLDVAVMERTRKAVVVPASFGWSDVGSFGALWSIGARDEAGNVVKGDVVLRDAENSYVRSESRLVAGVGIRDLVIVETQDAVLVAERANAQGVKAVVEELERAGRGRLLKAPPARLTWLDIAPGASHAIALAPQECAHLIVAEGEVTIEAGQRRKTAACPDSVALATGWTGRISTDGAEPARCLLVALGPG